MSFKGTLLPYQPGAVERMITRGNALVSFDMGLGKTVITIAAVEDLMDSGRILKPGLVIALHSLKYQWATAIERFTEGTSTAIVIDGTPKQREAQYAQVRDWRNNTIDYVILNYEQVVNDWDEVKTLPRGFMVLDECTAIKGFRAQRSERIKQLPSRFRFALTGTPLENGKPEELFSIMQFVDPRVLGRFYGFDKAYIERDWWGGIKGYQHLDELREELAPVMIRKAQTDPDVAPFLPDTIFQDPIMIQLDSHAKRTYRAIVADLLEALDSLQELSAGGGFDLAAHYGEADEEIEQVWDPVRQARGAVMSRLTALRQLCDHPDLLKISAAGRLERGEGSKYAAELLERGLLDDLKATPKMDAVVRYVREWLDLDDRHKVVVFSVFVPTLDLLADRLKAFGPTVYSGKMSAKAKEASKVKFQTDPKTRVLISSDAGGYGVDLPQANLLVNYDLPWSPGAADQRNGRIQRASSEWPSIVIQDFLVKGSVEERQAQRLDQKDSVAAAIMDGSGIQRDGGLSLDLSSLGDFLRTRMV